MNTPTQYEYEHREYQMFQKQLRDAGTDGTRAERQQDIEDFRNVLKNDPALVAQRVGWLIDGCYGFGSYKQARIVAEKPWMNRAAWMVQTIGAIEWRVSKRHTVSLWKQLTKPEQAALNTAVMAEVDYYITERKAEEQAAPVAA